MYLQMSALIITAATLKAFTVLPYMQIDFIHYLRLAQCDAKCAEKVVIKYSYIISEDCVIGCNRQQKTTLRQKNLTENVLRTGMQFWRDTNAYANLLDQSPIDRARLGCFDTWQEYSDIEASAEGLIFVELKNMPRTPIRYIVQWKAKSFGGTSNNNKHWITASIESEPIIKVDGMLASLQYKFLITAVDPSGRLGSGVTTDWIKLSKFEDEFHVPAYFVAQPILITTHYNTDYGLHAIVELSQLFYHSNLNSPDDGKPKNCHYSMLVKNETWHQAVDFTLDFGHGILLMNLQFSSEYSIILEALQLVDFNAQANIANANSSNRIIQEKFITPTCNEIFGSGSLKCDPEPVKNLNATVQLNGTVNIQWVPSSNSNTILFYHLLYYSTENSSDCDNNTPGLYISAVSCCLTNYANFILNLRKTTIQLKKQTNCEYLIKLINYDLIGRDASAEVIVQMQTIHPLTSVLLIILACSVILLIILIILLNYFVHMYCCKNSNSQQLHFLLSSGQKYVVTLC
ncbi:unnamed protein product [Thelazia callipaeda]|uniref:Fibronectin type-III domain-containing protein n=1 Tax=Thelazia callipaeda TaxID=103827 RepID=A0A0N5D992_THECL|nr:unnamed protein product [Thelazia callipaeda]